MQPGNVPFERCYWVKTDELLAGAYPGGPQEAETTAKAAALLDAGIRTVINLTEAHETDLYGYSLIPYEPIMKKLAQDRDLEMELVSHPIHDMGVPTALIMKTILDDIDASLNLSRPVYVHCWGGYGRTGTVVGCWLARHGVALQNDALEAIRQLRQGLPGESPQTDDQRRLITDWKEGQ